MEIRPMPAMAWAFTISKVSGLIVSLLHSMLIRHVCPLL